MSTPGDARLFASAIALVSGIYSVASGIGGDTGMMPMNDTVMLLVGIVVIAHGVALLTPLAERLGRTSGPLMIVWAAIMIANQLVAAASGSMASWDRGMVALALLMIASGVIMSSGAHAGRAQGDGDQP
ncbi:MAG: hypothetical protein ACRDG7_16535 [Candidatus Limnocylindria bacterium]